jgi:LysM repeat protein
MRARVALGVALVIAALALAPPGARADLEPISYTVSRGDTAYRIAARHGLTLAGLRELNEGLDLNRLRAGQPLVVGHGLRVDHRIRPRETVAMIAERYGVSIHEIVRWNEGLDPARAAVDRELRIWARRDEPPSQSIGRPDAGELAHGIPLPQHPAYLVRTPERAWVARHVAEHIARAFDAVLAVDSDAPRVQIRDASMRNGGRMREHRSHQSGRDVDLVYYQRRCREGTCGRRWMRPEDLDARLQWTLLETWLRAGAVEYVFIDHDLQEPLWRAALDAGATRAELARWFQWPRPPHARIGVIRHVPRHDEHLHVRFACAENDGSCVPTSHDRD